MKQKVSSESEDITTQIPQTPLSSSSRGSLYPTLIHISPFFCLHLFIISFYFILYLFVNGQKTKSFKSWVKTKTSIILAQLILNDIFFFLFKISNYICFVLYHRLLLIASYSTSSMKYTINVHNKKNTINVQDSYYFFWY